MAWHADDIDRVALELVHDLDYLISYQRQTRRLLALERELMRIRITEPTFFLGKDRHVDEILEDVRTGPHRSEMVPGGLKLIPQFVEMPEEIKQIIHDAANETASPAIAAMPDIAPVQAPALPTNSHAPGTFAEATAAVLKPAPKPIASINPTAALLSGLAKRRRKIEESIVSEAEAYGKALGDLETIVPTVFTQAKESLADRHASLTELSDSLKDFAGSNTDPLQN
jgi:hypothetical protein